MFAGGVSMNCEVFFQSGSGSEQTGFGFCFGFCMVFFGLFLLFLRVVLCCLA